MEYSKMIEAVQNAWTNQERLTAMPECVAETISFLDHGLVRAAEPDPGVSSGWRTNVWVKQGILLFFKFSRSEVYEDTWFDKVSTKFRNWSESDFRNADLRAVPGSVVRRGAFIGKKVVLMPSFVNIGGYVGDGSMVDTWSTVGSCAQIGARVHLSGGVGIGGVLEPIQANPTIIEDDVFIGARSEIAEGVIVRRRAVVSMGVFIGKTTPIVDRVNDSRIVVGEVPENAVVLPGIHPNNGLICPQIVKYRDTQTDSRTALNDALR